MGARFVNEVGGLLAVDRLLECSMEEGIFDVQLMNRPVAAERDGEDGADRRRFDDGAECFLVVDAGLLQEATEYPSGLVACKRSVGVELVAKNPFAGDDVGVGGLWNKGPCCVISESAELVEHGCTPIWILEGAAVCLGDRRYRVDVEVEDVTGKYTQTGLATSPHAAVVRDGPDGHSARVEGVNRCWWHRTCWSVRHRGR